MTKPKEEPRLVLEIKPTGTTAQYRVMEYDGFFLLDRIDRAGNVSHAGEFVTAGHAERQAARLIEAEIEVEARDGS